MSEPLKMIYSCVSDAMADIGAIGKGQVNTFQKYRFRGIDDVMNALYPVLVKHKLFLVPEVIDKQLETLTTRDGKIQIHSILTMKYTLYAADGSSISAVTIGEALDTSDKACNKSMAVAMKYAMFQLFCIPTEEMRMADPDNYDIKLATKDPVCELCGNAIEPVSATNNGVTVDYTVDSIIAKSQARFGKCLCWNCSISSMKK